MKKVKICVAMSGGVDSAVSAFILKKNGFYVEAIFMKNWHVKNYTECKSSIDYFYVRYICNLLNINLNILDFSKEYWNLVFTEFLSELNLAKTPNPDILCNRKIKFSVMLNYLISNYKFNYLATGHYSGIKIKNGKMYLKQSFDSKKDQTYFLNQININVQSKLIFPLYSYSKSEVRRLAKVYNLVNFNRKDSVGICFIGENNFFSFIKKYLSYAPGKIYTHNNLFLGWHEGLYLYTIGQKKNYTLKVMLLNFMYIKKILKIMHYMLPALNLTYFFQKKF